MGWGSWKPPKIRAPKIKVPKPPKITVPKVSKAVEAAKDIGSNIKKETADLGSTLKRETGKVGSDIKAAGSDIIDDAETQANRWTSNAERKLKQYTDATIDMFWSGGGDDGSNAKDIDVPGRAADTSASAGKIKVASSKEDANTRSGKDTSTTKDTSFGLGFKKSKKKKTGLGV